MTQKANEIPCRGTGQDGELQTGQAWPEPRFVVRQAAVLDKVTGLYWLLDADVRFRNNELAGGPALCE